MATPLLNLPGYNPGNSLLNFEPIQQALQQKIRTDQMQLENQFRERDFGMRETEFKAQQSAREDDRLQKLKQRSAGIAQLALEDQDQARGQQQFMRLYQSDPRWAQGFKQAGVDPTKDWRTAAQYLIAEARGYQDPLDRKIKEAQLAKTQREASGGNAEYGKSGAVFQGQDGKFYTIQFGSNGQRKIEPVEAGGGSLAPAKGVSQVGDELVSNATGAAVRNVAPQIAGAEGAKVRGREGADIETSFPKASASLRSISESQRVVLGTVDDTLTRINGYTAGLGGTLLSQLPGTEARDVKRALLTIKANIGFDKLQDMRANSPTGGALGAVAVQEMEALQSVLGALEPDQTPTQLRKNLAALKDTLQRFQRLREQAFAEQYAPVLQSRNQTAPRMEFNNLPPGISIERVGN
jgi:hypothetical protein